MSTSETGGIGNKEASILEITSDAKIEGKARQNGKCSLNSIVGEKPDTNEV